MSFREERRVLRNRVNIPPAQVQLKQNRLSLKRSAELNVPDGHCDSDSNDNTKPFHESDEPSAKRYATHQDPSNFTILKVFIFIVPMRHTRVFFGVLEC